MLRWLQSNKRLQTTCRKSFAYEAPVKLGCRLQGFEHLKFYLVGDAISLERHEDDSFDMRMLCLIAFVSLKAV
jgi:hypothetical protein